MCLCVNCYVSIKKNVEKYKLDCWYECGGGCMDFDMCGRENRKKDVKEKSFQQWSKKS